MEAEEQRSADERLSLLQKIPKGRYVDILQIDKGGFGCVFKAWDTKRLELCAIKRLTKQEHQRYRGDGIDSCYSADEKLIKRPVVLYDNYKHL